MSSSILSGTSKKFSEILTEAEHFYKMGAFERAHTIYLQARNLSLDQSEARWVAFRLADTAWRSEFSAAHADTTRSENASAALEALVAEVEERERDRVWAEANESLGDYWWLGPKENANRAWHHYRDALDWWAGVPDVELARTRYIQMVWKIVDEAKSQGFYSHQYSESPIPPLEVLEKVVEIARSEADRHRAQYLVAFSQAFGQNREAQRRAPEAFEAAIAAGKGAAYYDAALYYYATFLAEEGRAELDKDGQWIGRRDMKTALELYRRLVWEFRRGETAFFDRAEAAIVRIEERTLDVMVSNVFLPGSDVEYYLSWKNVDRIEFSLHRVDLTKDLRFRYARDAFNPWENHIDPDRENRIRTWTVDGVDAGDFLPKKARSSLPDRLEPGAYLLEATAGDLSSRALILVSDLSVVVKTSCTQAVIYVCDVYEGAPVQGASVLFRWWNIDDNGGAWCDLEGTTDEDGLVRFTLPDQSIVVLFFGAAFRDNRQAFVSPSRFFYGDSWKVQWKVYAFTDRTAYRPGETVQWKVIARQYDGERYTTPAGSNLTLRIFSDRGDEVLEQDLVLNAFGSAWGTLNLENDFPVGEYRMELRAPSSKRAIATARLFRLEEYKLPEFKVMVHVPEEDGKGKVFRLGDRVDVEVEVSYYFGGPVAGASVELVLYRTLFVRMFQSAREYPWLYRTLNAHDYGDYLGEVVTREKLKTDVRGRVTFSFKTHRSSLGDEEYHIEARVSDASRREIVGTGIVRVTRQAYHVYLEPSHRLCRPGEQVEVKVKVVDPNDQPVAAEGTIEVARDFWHEVWIDPQGRQVEWEEVRDLKARLPVFPPPPQTASERAWHLMERGCHHEHIRTVRITTGPDGHASFRFEPPKEGGYTATWKSLDPGYGLIKAQTSVWALTHQSVDIGHHGDLEIILDQDAVRAGQSAMVMLSSSESGRYILFSTEGEDLHDLMLVRMDGPIKLISIPIKETYEPVVFLNALSICGVRRHRAEVELAVPPVEHFLTVDVRAERPRLEPGDSAAFSLSVFDVDGNPVEGELTFSLFDESVLHIQPEYAGDPLAFFFEGDRISTVFTKITSLERYVKLVLDPGVIRAGLRVDHEVEQKKQKEMDDHAMIVSSPPPNDAADVQTLAATPVPVQASPPAGKGPVPGQKGGEASGESGEPIQVRSDFRATAFWKPDIYLEHGEARIETTIPDSLTTWHGVARVATRDDRFGWAQVSVRTALPMMVRLQGPRFFVVGDQPTISALVDNSTEKDLGVRLDLDVEGARVTGVSGSGVSGRGHQASVQVPAEGQARIDWTLALSHPGEVRVRVEARSASHGDAMVKRFPVFAHGIEKAITRSGKLRNDSVEVAVDLPEERAPGTTHMTVRVTPSLVVSLLDALPYLIHYPYGCIEQTMSRFLPALITARTLHDLGLDPEQVQQRPNAGPGLPRPQVGAPWNSDEAGPVPLGELDDVLKAGLERLYDSQHTDGGWGWWKEGSTDEYMTSYVVWGLTLAQSAGVNVRSQVVARARDCLEESLVKAFDRPLLLAWMLHAFSISRAESGLAPRESQEKAFEHLWTRKDRLNAFGKALLALTAHLLGKKDAARILIMMLENGVIREARPDQSLLVPGQTPTGEETVGTAHWGRDGFSWSWFDGSVETTAFALRGLLTVAPDHELIEPVTNWLLKNRRGARWSNTRDTAIVVLAMNEYIRTFGEIDALADGVEFEVRVNGEVLAEQTVSVADLLQLESRFEVPTELLRTGTNTVRITRTRGAAPLYFSVEAAYFSQEEPVRAAGNGIFVYRQYFRLVPRPTLLKGYVYGRTPLNDGDVIKSGERVEVLLTVESKSDCEYLVFEDLKPAGFESEKVRSGETLWAREITREAARRRLGVGTEAVEPGSDSDSALVSEVGKAVAYTGRTVRVYEELRDRKVAFFVDRLPEGFWEVRYKLRAETPGEFHALPVMVHAMYAPEIRANGREVRVKVLDVDHP